tara:strand:- start:130 stop:435 length:306 start_codon:yes stop_codon:yes gene_type:complete
MLVPTPPPSSDLAKNDKNAQDPFSEHSEEIDEEPIHVKNNNIKDLDGLVGALDRHVNEIRAHYRKMHRQLEEREKKDIENFYKRVHSGLDERQPNFSCPIS